MSQFNRSFAIKTFYLCTITFSFEEEEIKYFINKHTYIDEAFKKFCSETDKIKIF